MQEYPDMARLKTLATDFLKRSHPDVVTAVNNAFAQIVPLSQADSRSQADIFHFITSQFYDSQGRTAKLKGPPPTPRSTPSPRCSTRSRATPRTSRHSSSRRA